MRIPDIKVISFMAFTAIGMMATLIVDMVIARLYGTGKMADLYVLLCTIPVFVDVVIRGGVRQALVPVMGKSWSENNLDNEISRYLNLGLIAGAALLIVLALAGSHLLVLIGGVKYKQDIVNLMLEYYVLLMVIPAGIMTAMLGAVLIYNERAGLLAHRDTITAGFTVLFIALDENTSIMTIAIGMVVGAYVNTLLAAMECKKIGIQYSFNKWPNHKIMYEIRGAVGVTTMSTVVGQLGRLMERAIVARVGGGALAEYYFAFRIYSAVQTVVGFSVAVKSMGKSNKQAHKKGSNSGQLIKCTLLAMIAALTCFFGSELIIKLLYGSGAFSAESQENAASILKMLSVGMVFHVLIPVLEVPFYMSGKLIFVLKNTTMMVLSRFTIIAAIWVSYELTTEVVAIGVTVSSMLGCLYLKRTSRVIASD